MIVKRNEIKRKHGAESFVSNGYFSIKHIMKLLVARLMEKGGKRKGVHHNFQNTYQLHTAVELDCNIYYAFNI